MVNKKGSRHPNRRNRNRNMRRNLRENQIFREQDDEDVNFDEEGFQMNEVHVHLTCHCSYLPMMKLNEEKGVVEIPVPSLCPTCRVGTTTGVVLGGVICDTDGKCPHPGCNCEFVTMMVPCNQFLHFLQA